MEQLPTSFSETFICLDKIIPMTGRNLLQYTEEEAGENTWVG